MRTAIIYNFLIEANIMAGLAILLMLIVRKFFRRYLGSRRITLLDTFRRFTKNLSLKMSAKQRSAKHILCRI